MEEEKIVQQPDSQPVKDEKLEMRKLAMYANQLEARLKSAYEELDAAQKQLEFYQMQDYYQRAQMLCVILANDKLNPAFREKCEAELMVHVYPPQPEPKKESKE